MWDQLPSTGYRFFDHLIISALIVLVALLLDKILKAILNRKINQSSTELRVDPTNYTFLKNALTLIIIVAALIAILYSIPEFKQFGLTLFAGAGIFAAILGFASQAAFSNIISGIFMVIFKPFRVGDIVEGPEYSGKIEDITLRHVVICDWQNRRFVVPNSVISGQIINNFNLYDEKINNWVWFSIAYDSDLLKAIEIVKEEAEAHPFVIDNRTNQEIEGGVPKVIIRVMKLNDSSVDLRANCWSENFSRGFDVKSDLNKSVKLRFDKEGIEIPFPHRTIVHKEHGKVK